MVPQAEEQLLPFLLQIPKHEGAPIRIADLDEGVVLRWIDRDFIEFLQLRKMRQKVVLRQQFRRGSAPFVVAS
jgi:hypothetical protein